MEAVTAPNTDYWTTTNYADDLSSLTPAQYSIIKDLCRAVYRQAIGDAELIADRVFTASTIREGAAAKNVADLLRDMREKL
jgi:hypothetical protein